MSIFDDIFGNSRSQQGAQLYGGQMQDYTDLINGVGGLKSNFGGVNNLQDEYSKFGLSPFDLGGYQNQVQRSFAPGKANLATALAKNRGAIASRQGGGSASPEAMFSGAEGNYAQALGGLEGQEGNAMLGGYDKQRQSQQFNADFLSNIFGNQDSYQKWKLGVKAGLMNDRSGATKDYLGTQSGSSIFDDITGLVSSGLQTAGSLGFKPFAKN